MARSQRTWTSTVRGPLRVARSPDALEELAPGVRAARVRGEQREQAVLLGPEVDRRAAAPELVAGEVELQAVGDRERGAGVGAVPGAGLEPGEPAGELGARGGRRERVVEAQREGGEPLLDGVGRREVERAQPGPAPALGGDELQVLGAGRRLAGDDDPGPFREQDVAEAAWIGR